MKKAYKYYYYIMSALIGSLTGIVLYSFGLNFWQILFVGFLFMLGMLNCVYAEDKT